MKKEWVIYKQNGDEVGRLSEDKADDKKDAVLNFADEYLFAKLESVLK